MVIYVCRISFKWSTIFLSLAKYILYNLSGFLWYGWTYNAYWQWTSGILNSSHCFNPIAFRIYSWRRDSELNIVALTGSWLFLPCLASDLGKATFTGMESKLKLIRLSLILVSAVLHQSLLVRKKFLFIRGCDVIKFRSCHYNLCVIVVQVEAPVRGKNSGLESSLWFLGTKNIVRRMWLKIMFFVPLVATIFHARLALKCLPVQLCHQPLLGYEDINQY